MKILLGVSGSVAAYKAAILARLFCAANCQVKTMFTDSAHHFVGHFTFAALTGNEVRSDAFDQQAEQAMSHIELARWGDVLVIAPASANLLARMAAGVADDLLTTTYLATLAPVVVAPAMNVHMWRHAATQHNIALLQERGVRVLGPGKGEQACGDEGEGRMLEPQDIADALLASASPVRDLEEVSALVTAGPTAEFLDPVRMITNRSSGRMGFACAQALAQRGAKVKLIAGPASLPTPAGVQRVDVQTSAQMLDAVMQFAPDCSIAFCTAAVCDYRPQKPADQKIKRDKNKSMTLKLEACPDVLATLVKKFPEMRVVGFAAETENVEANANAKRERKGVYAIVANDVSRADIGFDTAENEVSLITAEGIERLPFAPKLQVAHWLIDRLAPGAQPSS